MTDWIDQLAAKLNEDQKRENLHYANKLKEDELIKARAPEFARDLLTSLAEKSAELKEKLGGSLGGVNVNVSDERFAVSNHGKVESVELTAHVDLPARHIDLRVIRKGTGLRLHDSGGPGPDRYVFKIDRNDRLIASLQGGDQSFHNPEEMASAVLKAVFTIELFRPY